MPGVAGTVRDFQQALRTFFDHLPEAQASGVALPEELSNLDQLKVLLEVLPDYPCDDAQPSYVLAIPCRPVLLGLSSLLPGLAAWGSIDWAAVAASVAATAGVALPGEEETEAQKQKRLDSRRRQHEREAKFFLDELKLLGDMAPIVLSLLNRVALAMAPQMQCSNK